MNTMKKIATLLLVICLVIPCFSMLTYAANGKVMFTDPITAVGETLELKGVIEAGSAIEDRKVVISYDTSMLKFKSGDHVTETAAGQLTYELKGEKSGTRVEFLMYFDVLKEGTATVKAQSAEAFTTTNQKITWTSLGSSKVTINPGQANVEPADEPADAPETSTSAIVDIDGVSYTFSEQIPSDEIPEGFTVTTLEYAGAQHRIVEQESTGIKLGYMVPGDGEGKFFMYVEENATFVPFEQIEISQTVVITILSYVENVTLPAPYVATTVTINEVQFPGWQNSEKPELCILYALNSAGEKTFYQFDTVDGTYQRFEVPTVEVEEEDTSLVGKLNEVMGEHLDAVVIGVGVLVIVFLILIIILSVKLYNRNAELDEIYDEYGIGLDDEDDNTEDDEDDDVVYMDDEEDNDEDYTDDEVEDNIEIEEDVFFEQPTEELDEAEWDIALLDEDEEDEPMADDEKNGLFEDEDFEDDEDDEDDEDFDFEMDFIDLDE